MAKLMLFTATFIEYFESNCQEQCLSTKVIIGVAITQCRFAIMREQQSVYSLLAKPNISCKKNRLKRNPK